jgi:hypothetical protein
MPPSSLPPNHRRYRPTAGDGLGAALTTGKVGWNGVGLGEACAAGDGDGAVFGSGDGLAETGGASGGRVGC